MSPDDRWRIQHRVEATEAALRFVRGRRRADLDSDDQLVSDTEKLQATEALLDETAGIKSPEWHRDILAERQKSIEEGTAEYISLEELRARGRT